MATGPAYAAFISYSRAVDGRLAPRLQGALERFGKPWYRLRAIRVFRDDASLSANPGLWSSLTGALERAEYFILLASPGSAASEWVNREVEYWIAHRDRALLLLVLTEGEIAWDEHAANFDWARATAVPRALSGAYGEEPRYTDLRFAATSEHLSLRDPRFRDAVADVAAPLNGRAKDDMIGEEVRQHRRTLRIARGAGVSLAALTAAASVAAVLAIRAADRADRERDRAEQEARVATSRQLAAQTAVAVRDGRLEPALTQAVRAWRIEPTSQARDALLGALKAATHVVGIVPTRRSEAATVSADGRRAALRDFEPSAVRIVDVASGRAIGEPVRLPVDTALALDPAGTRLAVGGGRGRIEVIKLESGTRRTLTGPVPLRPFERDGAQDFTPPVGARSLAFSPDGRALAWSGPREYVSLWDGRRMRRMRPPEPPGPGGWSVAVGDGGRIVAANGAASGEIVVWRAGRASQRPRMLSGRPPVFSASEAGEHGPIAIGAGRRPLLAVGGEDDGRVDVRDARTGKRLHTLRTGRGEVSSLVFSPSGRVLSVVDAGGVTLWRAAAGQRLARFGPAGAELGAAALDDARVVAIGADGAMTVRDLRAAADQIARPLLGGSELAPRMAFDPSGEHVSTLDRGGRVRLWRVADGRRGPPLTPELDAMRLAILPDGRLVTCCGIERGGPARIWTADGRAEEVATEAGASYDMTVTAGGRLVVSGETRRRAAVWAAGDLLELPRGTYSPDLSPDGRWVVARTDDDTWIWDVERRRRAAEYPPAEANGAFSPSGRLLAAATGERGSIGLFDPRSGHRVGLLGSDLEVSALRFSPDERVLAAVVTRFGTSGTYRTTLELWDVAARRSVGDEILLDWGETPGLLAELAFSPDGRALVVGGVGSEPLVLDLDPDRWAERACELAPSCGATPSTDASAARG